MDDNRPDDHAAAPDAGRPRRAPPTIDLEATEVKTSSENVGADNNAGDNAEAETETKPGFLPGLRLRPCIRSWSRPSSAR